MTAMDVTTRFTDVVDVLQDILKRPDLPSSEFPLTHEDRREGLDEIKPGKK
jgi:hypothetical protein